MNSVFSSSAAGAAAAAGAPAPGATAPTGAPHHHGRGGDAQALAQDLGHVVHFQEGEGADVVREANHAGDTSGNSSRSRSTTRSSSGSLAGSAFASAANPRTGAPIGRTSAHVWGASAGPPASRRRRPVPPRPRGRRRRGPRSPRRARRGRAASPLSRGGRHLCGPRAPIELRANARSNGEPPRDGRDETACVRRYARAWVDNAGVSARAIRGQRASRTAASRTFLSHPQSDCHAARTDARRISASPSWFRRGARGEPKNPPTFQSRASTFSRIARATRK